MGISVAVDFRMTAYLRLRGATSILITDEGKLIVAEWAKMIPVTHKR